MSLIWYMAQGYPVRGGHEAHILHYATEFKRRGYEVRVVVPNALPHKPHLFMTLLRERGVALRSLTDEVRMRADLLFACGVGPWICWRLCTGRSARPGAFRSFVESRLAAKALRRALEREEPDIIHIFGRLADNLWDELPADRVMFHHGTDGKVDASWSEAELQRFRTFAERVAVYAAPGAGVAENVKREFGIGREIVPVYTICPDETGGGERRSDYEMRERFERRVMVEGKDARETGERDWAPCESRRFGILCRMIPEKGITALMEGIRLFAEKHRNVRFLFAGAGSLADEVRAFVGGCGLPGVAYQETFGSPSEVLERIDVFVHPSVSDAMPMAIAEALMCGRPCIATRVGGIPDLVRDGVEGILIPGPPTDAAIAGAMERFNSMPADEYEGFARRARRRYEECCRPEKVGDAVEQVYGKARGKRGVNSRQ